MRQRRTTAGATYSSVRTANGKSEGLRPVSTSCRRVVTNPRPRLGRAAGSQSPVVVTCTPVRTGVSLSLSLSSLRALYVRISRARVRVRGVKKDGTYEL